MKKYIYNSQTTETVFTFQNNSTRTLLLMAAAHGGVNALDGIHIGIGMR